MKKEKKSCKEGKGKVGFDEIFICKNGFKGSAAEKNLKKKFLWKNFKLSFLFALRRIFNVFGTSQNGSDNGRIWTLPPQSSVTDLSRKLFKFSFLVSKA